MSVVHSTELKRLVRNGTLCISPILSESQVGEVAIDLRLGNVALFVRAAGLSHVDPEAYMNAESSGHRHQLVRRQKFERHEFQFGRPILLHPGSLTLVPTLEWVALPPTLKGVVTARSSWAREGLNIATANFINPGYHGVITLELANLGQIPIALYAGMRIAQIAFHQVARPRKVGNTRMSQFDLSFEPRAGEITKNDEAFINTSDTKARIRTYLQRAQNDLEASKLPRTLGLITNELVDAFPPSSVRDCLQSVQLALRPRKPVRRAVLLDLVKAALAEMSKFDAALDKFRH